MTGSNRRDTLIGLVSFLAATPAAAAIPGAPVAIGPGAEAISASYLASQRRPLDVRAIERQLLPKGWSDTAAGSLRRRIKADFIAGRTFVHRGWVLADTEGKLFVIAAT
jgi:hypothetical protein